LAWRIEFAESAQKQFAKLGRESQTRIRKFLRERIAPSEDPRDYASPLRSTLAGLWKFRIGNYRIVAEIRDEEVLVLVLRVGHRKNIYGGH
jgi:mRNA interferase RelE/StbE